MSDSRRSKAKARGEGPVSGRSTHDSGPATTVVRTVVSALVAVAGIVWMALYINIAQDGGQLTWMGDLQRWNFLIGFSLLFIGLGLAAHPSTPMGRGRGVVAGMLGCFLVGLVWIIVYYMAGQPTEIPVIRNLDAYNLIVGIGFMGVGFVYATRWE